MQGQEVIQEGFLGAAGVLCKALAQSGSDARTFRGRILKVDQMIPNLVRFISSKFLIIPAFQFSMLPLRGRSISRAAQNG